MEGLSSEQLAVASGTSEKVVRELIRTAIVREPARGEGHPPSDIARVRLALALEASGIPLDAVGAAIREGRISFDFLDALTPEPSRLLPHTMADTIDRLGIEPGLRRRIASILGTLAMSDDDPIRQEDAELFELVEGRIGSASATSSSRGSPVRSTTPLAAWRAPNGTSSTRT